MFAKVFSQIFDSSIAEDYNCRRMFMDLLVLSDSDGVVDMTPEAISRRTNVPMEQVVKYIAELCAPDPASRSKVHEGRRLISLTEDRDWGWRIVNFHHYRKIRDEEARRSYFRDAKRKQRKKQNKESKTSGGQVVDTGGLARNVASTSSSSETFRSKKGEPPSVLAVMNGFCAEWDNFVEHRKAKKQPTTTRAAELLLTELAKRPKEAVAALQTAIMRGWTGFKWEWIDNEAQKAISNGKPPWQSADERKQAEIDAANREYRLKKLREQEKVK